ncbi:MAG: hypothetical protein Q9220_003883 [cf. Caloplaca sp. 1 TL-2023]
MPASTEPSPREIDARTLLDDGTPMVRSYRLLIDTFRLRGSDSYMYGGKEIHWTTDYRGKEPIDDFRAYLHKAKVAEVLPSWWNNDRRAECRKLARDKEGYQYIGHATDLLDIEERYEDTKMVDRMRALAEAIYGSGFEYEDDLGSIQRVMRYMDATTPSRKSIKLLPRKPGTEREPYYELGPAEVSDAARSFEACMQDYSLVQDFMSVETYMDVMDCYGLSTIADLNPAARTELLG